MPETKILSEYEKKLEAWSILKVVYDQFEQSIPDYKKYEDKVLHNAIVVEATVNHKAAGLVAFYANDFQTKLAYISQIAVLPDMQRKGVGECLLKKCEEYCKAVGMKALRLEVKTDNQKAIAFYSKQGFLYECKASINSNYLIKEI